MPWNHSVPRHFMIELRNITKYIYTLYSTKTSIIAFRLNKQ